MVSILMLNILNELGVCSVSEGTRRALAGCIVVTLALMDHAVFFFCCAFMLSWPPDTIRSWRWSKPRAVASAPDLITAAYYLV